MKKFYSKIKTACIAMACTLLLAGTTKSQTIQTFTYTGALQAFTVPLCVSSISITTNGAQGGNSALSGGLGGQVKGVLNVTPGQVLNIYVGGQPTGTLGGFNGGGNGGVSFLNSGAGGGGASDVRVGGTALSNRVMVGGGGGGVGSLTTYNPTGGTGGGGDPCTSPLGYGGGGGSGCTGINGGNGGCAGSALATGYGTGGAGAGLSSGGPISGSGTGAYGAAGVLGIGGDGGSYSIGPNADGAGGGGGGYYGGAGGMSGSGGCNGGGGGGSSYANSTLLSNITFTGGVQSGNGSVILAYGFSSPGISTSLSNSSGVCPGGTTTITATGAAGSYSWSNSSATTSTISVSPNITTSYTVTGTSSNGCALYNITTVTVNPFPVVSVASSNSFICIGETASLTASGASTYTWYAGTASQTGTSIAANPTVTTTYTITGLSQAACASTSTFNVNVFPNLLTTTSNTTICKGKTVTLSASGAVSYTWSNGSPFASFTRTLGITTVFTVTSLDANNCTSSNTISVIVNPNPTVSATASATLICLGSPVILNASGASTYSWSTGATSASVSITPLIDIAYTYTVKGTDSFSCSSTATVVVNVNRCTGLSEIENSSLNISVFPNPNNGLLDIIIKNKQQDLKADIYDTSGHLVKTQVITAENTAIDLQKEAPGIYFIQVTGDNKAVYSSKIIKQ